MPPTDVAILSLMGNVDRDYVPVKTALDERMSLALVELG